MVQWAQLNEARSLFKFWSCKICPWALPFLSNFQAVLYTGRSKERSPAWHSMPGKPILNPDTSHDRLISKQSHQSTIQKSTQLTQLATFTWSKKFCFSIFFSLVFSSVATSNLLDSNTIKWKFLKILRFSSQISPKNKALQFSSCIVIRNRTY